jgi:large repetitive protein
MRLLLLAALGAALAATFAGTSSAIDINAEFDPPDALVGEPYEYQLEGEEGCPASYHFSVGPGYPFPPGLTLGDKGLISGVPTVPGTFTFFVRLIDDFGCSGNPLGSQGEFTIIVAPRLEITSPALLAPPLGTQFSTQLTASGGGTQEWAVVEGTLPENVTLSRVGLLSGVLHTPGGTLVTVQVSDPKRKATQRLAIGVSTLAVTTPALPAGVVLKPFTATLAATGGIGGYTWAVSKGALPGGLELDPSSGRISGAPRQAGAFPLEITVTDAIGLTATTETTLNVAQRLRIVRPSAPVGTVGSPYVLRLEAKGGVPPRTWTVDKGELPSGLELNARTGVISGRPTEAGRTPVVVAVTDAAGNVNRWWLPILVRA